MTWFLALSSGLLRRRLWLLADSFGSCIKPAWVCGLERWARRKCRRSGLRLVRGSFEAVLAANEHAELQVFLAHQSVVWASGFFKLECSLPASS